MVCVTELCYQARTFRIGTVDCMLLALYQLQAYYVNKIKRGIAEETSNNFTTFDSDTFNQQSRLSQDALYRMHELE